MHNSKIEWREIKKDFEERRKSYFNFNFIFKNGKTKIKKIKFDRDPKKLQGGSGGPLGIRIDKLFFEFGDKEKVALLWHELFHSRIANLFRIKLFSRKKNLKYKEEFRADNYSALNNSIKDCLSYLFKIKEIYLINPELYNPKTHPSIEKRIEEIKKLKVKKDLDRKN